MRGTVLAALAVVLLSAQARAQKFSAEDLARRAVERRAVEAGAISLRRRGRPSQARNVIVATRYPQGHEVCGSVVNGA